MKKHFTSIITTMALVVIALCLSSCNKEEDTTPVVGASYSLEYKWKCTYSPFKSSPEDIGLVFYEGDRLALEGGYFTLESKKQESLWGYYDLHSSKLFMTPSNAERQVFELKWVEARVFDLYFDYNGQDKSFRFER